MNKKIKMIVMDLDDTLLNDDLIISEYTKQVIFNAQEAGIKIVIASGRPTPAIIPYAKELRLKENYGFMISYNGAILTDCATDQVIKSTMLTLDNVEFVKKQAVENNLFFQTYINGEVIVDRSNEYTDFEGKLTKMPIVIRKDILLELDHEVVKIILTDEASKIKKVEESLIPLVGESMTMNISKPFFLEFTNIAVDKNKTISVLCEKLGIEKDEVMAIGDSFNDLTMIQGCGIGVVMENGADDVKKYANHITHCNNKDGVATAINRFALAR